ncbi:MAG: hypothetical protein P8Y36_06435, partial [Alphaproteobacteria bacterium]
MNGRSLVIHPAHQRPMHRKRSRRRSYKRPSTGISNFITMIAAALFLGSLSFAAVAIDWPAFLSSGEPMTLSQAKNMALKLSGRRVRTLDTPEEIKNKAATMASLGIAAKRAKAKLSDVQIRLEPPGGHCFLDPHHPGDARLYTVFERIFRGDIRMLNGFADCQQLKTWRTGRRATLNNYGNVLIPVAMLNRTVKGSPRQYVDTVCRTMRQNAGEFRGRNMPGLKARFDKALAKAPI